MSGSLEKLCQQLDLSYELDSDGICVRISVHYPEARHSIRISTTANGRLGVMIVFEESRTKEIADVEDFCSNVQKQFKSNATLSYDAIGGCFFMYDVIEPGALRTYLKKFAHDCDIARPLLESVGTQGYCDPRGIWLAHLQPSEMGGHIH